MRVRGRHRPEQPLCRPSLQVLGLGWRVGRQSDDGPRCLLLLGESNPYVGLRV